MVSFLDPSKLITQLPLKDGDIVADFGAGSGGWTIPLAKKLRGGRIYAFDIQPEVLSALKGRAELEGIHNIETRICNLEEPQATKLENESVDMVLIANVLFEIEDKPAILKEAKRILKPQGKLVIIDWQPGAPIGPKQGVVSPQEIKALFENLGLELEKESKAGAFHYLIIGRHKIY